LIPPLVLMVHFGTPELAGGALLTAQLVGLAVLLARLARSAGVTWWFLLVPVAAHSMIFFVIGGIARLGASASDHWGWQVLGSMNASAVLSGSMAAGVGVLVLLATLPSLTLVRVLLRGRIRSTN
jgi:hypothetical protein